MPRSISYVFILIGGAIAIYAQAQENQSQYVLIVGIVLLMLGIYSISRNIPSKNEQEENDSEL
ncbi:hypothetical protein [Psychroserpens sp. MEBiC05023]